MLPKSTRTLALSAGAALALLAGCAGGSENEQEPTADAPSEISAGAEKLDGKEVQLGLLTGLTGDYSAFSDAVINGSRIAIEDINNMGGILGRPATLVVQDNKSTPEGAVSGFQKLARVDDVVGVGGVESDGGVAVIERAAEQEVPTICSFCGTPILDTKGGDFVWRFTASDTDGGAAVAQFAREAGIENASILAQEGEVGRPSEIFKEIFEEDIGGEVLEDVRFDSGKASYQAELQQAFEGDPEAVYLAAGHEAAASILPEWERRDYGGKFYVSPDLITPETTFEFLQDGVATGTIAAFAEESEGYKHFAERLEGETGEAPSEGLGEPNNYDSFIALALAITAADTTDGAAVNEQIPAVLNPPGAPCAIYEDCVKALEAGEEIDYNGASSSLDVNEAGNLSSPVMAEIQLKEGEWVPVDTIELDPSLKP